MLQRSLFATLFAASLAALPIPAQPADSPKPIQISMARSFFHDQPSVFVDLAAFEFKEVMKNATGLKGEVHVNYAANEIAQKINDRQLDFGILYAHEFAWVQKKYPDLQPFLVAGTKQDKRVHFIVHQKSTAKSLADLRGKKFDMPAGTKEYSRLYLNKACPDRERHFGSVVKSATYIEALNQLARGDSDVTIIDSLWLDSYKSLRGPVFTKNLRILQESEVVPPAALICKKGALPPATMDTIRKGLLKAHEETRGRDLLALWTIDAFEVVPKDYARSLDDVLKIYPAP